MGSLVTEDKDASSLMKKRERDRRAQYGFVAGHAIEACRLQHQRITSGQSAPRHDLDFYVMALWRLHEIARMVGNRCSEQAAKDADELFLSELPRLSKLRNWWVHPPDPGRLGWVSWVQQDIARMLPDGSAEFLVDVEVAQPAAERLYETLRWVLGEPPRG
jgi:hypothetical protein